MSIAQFGINPAAPRFLRCSKRDQTHPLESRQSTHPFPDLGIGASIPSKEGSVFAAFVLCGGTSHYQNERRRPRWPPYNRGRAAGTTEILRPFDELRAGRLGITAQDSPDAESFTPKAFGAGSRPTTAYGARRRSCGR